MSNEKPIPKAFRVATRRKRSRGAERTYEYVSTEASLQHSRGLKGEGYIISGTLIELYGQGVLLQGPSGSGKSVLALALIDRGHRLIADDAVWLEKENGSLLGQCPPLIQDFMAFRELGMINIRKLRGDTAIRLNTLVKLVMTLDSTSQQPTLKRDEAILIKDVSLPLFIMPFNASPSLVEVTVQNFQLNQQGYSALDEFNRRHEQITHQAIAI